MAGALALLGIGLHRDLAQDGLDKISAGIHAGR
jgi:hypothetical protein